MFYLFFNFLSSFVLFLKMTSRKLKPQAAKNTKDKVNAQATTSNKKALVQQEANLDLEIQ